MIWSPLTTRDNIYCIFKLNTLIRRKEGRRQSARLSRGLADSLSVRRSQTHALSLVCSIMSLYLLALHAVPCGRLRATQIHMYWLQCYIMSSANTYYKLNHRLVSDHRVIDICCSSICIGTFASIVLFGAHMKRFSLNFHYAIF